MTMNYILLVEDNEADVELFSECLDRERFDLTLTVARDGVEAMEMLLRYAATPAERPDIVFLDLNLPRLGGREVLDRVRADPRLRDVPILVLSSSDAPDDIGACYSLGANCYLTKPIDFRKYRDLVHTVQEFWLSLAKLPPAKVDRNGETLRGA
jgi:CheY-like chemotaxis protein